MTTMLDFLRLPALLGLGALAVGLLVLTALAALRIAFRKTPAEYAVTRSAAEALVSVSLVVILVVALRQNQFVDSSINLVPLSGVAAALRSGSGLELAVVNLLGNCVIFLPLGVGLAWLSPARHGWVLVAAIVAISLGVEVAQWLLDVGRASDIDDVLMNGLGGCLGIIAGRHLGGRLPVRPGPMTLKNG